MFPFFLPFATERPRRRTPLMTYALLIANCVVYFLYELPYWQSGGQGVGPFAFIPSQPSVGSLLLSMFSHAGFMHLAGNMLFLWLFGTVVEDVLGPILFLAFYFGGQMGAMLLEVSMTKAFSPASLSIPQIGASGAIAGILGLSAVCFAKVRVRVFYLFGFFIIWRAGVARIQAWLFLGFWLLQQLGGAFLSTTAATQTGEAMGGVAYWAHIGGFAAGMIGALILALPGKIRRHDLLSGVPDGDSNGYRHYADLSEIVRRSPEDAEAWLALARSKELLGLTRDAVEAYAHAARLFLEQHEPERAARAYQAVAEHDPDFVLPPANQFDVAIGFARAGEPRQALTALNRLLQAYPTSSEAEVALLRAGELAEQLGDRQGAQAYFDGLLRRYPHSTWRDYARQKLAGLGG